MEFKIILFRIALTFILASLFGLERQRSHKPAGFASFVFVAIGSCSLSIMALTIQYEDPIPLLAAIVTGVGFLGAGALIRTNDKVFGFTTATSIWLFAVFGLIIGMGYYNISIIVYSFMWISILTDRYLDKRKDISYQKKLNFKLNKLSKDHEVIKLFDEFKIKKYKLLSKKINKDTKTLSLTYLFEGSGNNIRNLLAKIEDNPSIIEFSME